MTVQLELVPLRGNENEANETGSWYLFGVLFKISYKQPPFLYATPTPLPPRGQYISKKQEIDQRCLKTSLQQKHTCRAV